jgi:hypothetical protein
MTNNIFITLGASSHTGKERHPDDYYATDPIAAELLLQQEDFLNDIWECASGENHLADVFTKHGHIVRMSDIVKRTPTTEIYDFLSMDNTSWRGGYSNQSTLQAGNRVHL